MDEPEDAAHELPVTPPPLHLPEAIAPIGERASAMVDLLRGIFAILVLIAHSFDALYPAPEATRGLSLHSFLAYSIGHAGIWVAGFFVISGFCVHLSIRNSLQRERWSWGSYLAARVTRIYPLTLAGLLLAAAVWFLRKGGDAAFPWRPWWATWLMAQNFAGLFPHYSQSWSLTNEMVYYLAWPVSLAWSRFRIRPAFRSAGWVTLVVVMISAGVWKVAAGGRPDHWLVPIWTTAAAFVWWLAGAALIESWNALTRIATPRRCAWMLPLSALPVGGAFLLGAQGARTSVSFLSIYGCIPFFCLLVLAGRHSAWLETRGGARLAAFFGLLSFPVYVFHVQVIDLLAPLITGSGNGFSRLGSFAALTTAVFVVCGGAGAFLESHLLAARARFLRGIHPSRTLP